MIRWEDISNSSPSPSPKRGLAIGEEGGFIILNSEFISPYQQCNPAVKPAKLIMQIEILRAV